MSSLQASRPGSASSGASSSSSHDAAALMADAISDFLNTDAADAADAKSGADSFLRAYSTLARSVPKPRRRALYRMMGAALAAAAERDGVEGAADADNAAFLASLREEESGLRQRDLAEGRLLSAAAMRERLGVSRQALSAALRAQRMFALAGPSGEYLYPAFFADPGQDRAVLEKVCRALGGLPGGAKWEFFTTPKVSLGRKTPLQVLAKGRIDAVLAAAAAFAES
jgi:hypothetical protein